jgi:ubiquinone biosynthesis protein UbiJ
LKHYRTPFPRLLASALESSLNQLLSLDEQSEKRIRNLKGRELKLELDGLDIALHFSFPNEEFRDGIVVSLDGSDEPDTEISGSPTALFAMAVPTDGGSWGVPGSAVKISGDAGLARDLERLFSRLDPDWEAPLARLFGDVLGYQMASGIRQGVAQAKETAGASGELLQEYFRQQPDLMVPAEEFSHFADAVDEVRDAVDRLEARVRQAGENLP